MKYLLLVFLVGCGPETPTWQFDCLTIEVPTHNVLLNKRAIEPDVALAKKLFDRRYGEGTFCKRASYITVTLEPKLWECGSPSIHIDGSYGPNFCDGEWLGLENRIKLIDTGKTLLHEFVHAQETFEWRPGTSWHEGWYENGQYTLIFEYQRTYIPWHH